MGVIGLIGGPTGEFGIKAIADVVGPIRQAGFRITRYCRFGTGKLIVRVVIDIPWWQDIVRSDDEASIITRLYRADQRGVSSG
jgi:hypothetical protein